jgi:peroxiredoxin
MAKTYSKMPTLGTPAPIFSLPDVVSNEIITLPQVNQYVATVIFFICNHCPFVKHIQDELVRLANDYMPKQVRFIAINSNDIENYPDDSPAHMQAAAKNHNYPFPYLFDESQDVAKAYQAACTPDFFIFDSNLSLVYRGQLDDSRPFNNLPLNGESMRRALDQLITNEPISTTQKPSMGCNIKWKK